MTEYVFKDIHFDIFMQKWINVKYPVLSLNFLRLQLMKSGKTGPDFVYNISIYSPEYKVKEITEKLKIDKKFIKLVNKYQKSKKRFHFFPVTQDPSYFNQINVLQDYNFALHDSNNNSVDIFDTIVVKDYVDLGKYRKQFKILFEIIYGPNVIINYRNNVLKRFNSSPNSLGKTNFCKLEFIKYPTEVLDSNFIQVLWFLEKRLLEQEDSMTTVIEKISKLNSECTCCLLNEYSKTLRIFVEKYSVTKGKISKKNNFFEKVLKFCK